MNLTISAERRPSGKEAVDLFLGASWGGPKDYDETAWDAALKLGGIVLTAYEGDKLVAMLRGLTDNICETHITDIIVSPAYQRQGIGTALVRKVMADYGQTAIYVSALAPTEDFFIKCGLRKQRKLVALAIAAQAP
jgi:ribosomal protein S18 acetylase RimI-like enzyme